VGLAPRFRQRFLAPTECSDRRQGGQVFGDIVDTFGPAVESSDIDGCNHFGTEEGIEDAVFYGRSECDSFAAEGFGDFDRAAEEADVPALLHTAHDVARGVLERCDGLDIVASAGLIAAGRHGKLERLVRPLSVVDHAPVIEGALGSGEIGKGRSGQRFGFEAAMEAFVLAHGLRMIGPRVADLDILFDQPDAERGEWAARSIAPGRAVVGDHSVGQAIAPKGADQLLSDRLGPLVGAGRKHDCEARVVVEHGERMQAADSHRHMPLKSICHNSFGRARSKRMKAVWPPP
jgi:hypothetical protein